MGARPVDEAHRAVTPLELFFDLTFVAAVAQLSGNLAHATIDGHSAAAIGPFLMVFFAIWWAWMSFTWFASAYDCDDVTYRLAAFVQMGGVLVLAAGIGPAFESGDYAVVTLGYLIMRLALLSMWIRAWVQHPSGRATSLRYAGGLTALEVLWVARLPVGNHWTTVTFLVLVFLELTLPAWAERPAPTSWHPHHIAERYALFAIILLGEGVFAASSAVSTIVEDAGALSLTAVAMAALSIVAAVWWRYFVTPAGAQLEARRGWSFVWGYGHYFVFAALGALAAGLEVVVAASVGRAQHLAVTSAVAAVAVPVAGFLVVLDLITVPAEAERPRVSITTSAVVAGLAAVVLVADHTGLLTALALVAAITVGAAASDEVAASRHRNSRKEVA